MTMESQSLIVSLLDVRMYFLKGLKKQETLKLQLYGELNFRFQLARKEAFLLRQLDEDMATRFCLQGRGLYWTTLQLFNITETVSGLALCFYHTD